MVAKQHINTAARRGSLVLQAHHQAQDVQPAWPAVKKVPKEPEAVDPSAPVQAVINQVCAAQQCAQPVQIPVDIANHKSGHRWCFPFLSQRIDPANAGSIGAGNRNFTAESAALFKKGIVGRVGSGPYAGGLVKKAAVDRV